MIEPAFRLATRADIAQVLANETAAYLVPWGKQALIDSLQDQYFFWLIMLDHKVVGHLIYQVILDESHLLNICIQPRHQGKGLGQRLLDFWLEQSTQADCVTAMLEVRVSNQVAINLYQSKGFQLLTQRKGYYPLPRGLREDGLIMSMAL
ncbi:MAG: ribosomal protein S18-alanine N-acetyltransferase [Kangiellaceae bacterium]|jgi:ribosomal-protein-alanine N-acetyltransferase|nr:ribosomal protein S18-alanine N-acetyltransferase [Kangiellaceae bacterium]